MFNILWGSRIRSQDFVNNPKLKEWVECFKSAHKQQVTPASIDELNGKPFELIEVDGVNIQNFHVTNIGLHIYIWEGILRYRIFHPLKLLKQWVIVDFKLKALFICFFLNLFNVFDDQSCCKGNSLPAIFLFKHISNNLDESFLKVLSL